MILDGLEPLQHPPGPQEELEQASHEVRGHALTLSLMGRYLTLTCDPGQPPDIARRDCLHFAEADAEIEHGHAFRVVASAAQSAAGR